MSRALVGLLVLLPALSQAQVDGGAPAGDDAESLRRDFDAKLEAARREVKELREEMRAQLATQSTRQGWQEEWVGEKRKLELVTLDGYLRARPELFYKFDMGRGNDPAGYSLWPRSPISGAERTNAGVNMRFRLEPTINVSEEVRIRAQIDALDNMVWGSTPDYAYSLNSSNNYAYDRNQFSIFSFGQAPQRSGINSLADSIAVKRVWGEVDTPIGLFRFGRMGSHWGLGMLHNDGNGIDSDWGDTVDRFSFTAEPIPGFYASAMLDFNVEGLISARQPAGGQPIDLSTLDDTHSYILVLARRDTEQERQAKLNSGQTVLNYGVHFTYRTQRDDAVDSLSGPFTIDGQTMVPTIANPVWVPRRGQLFIPDLWGKIEQKNWRIEAEAAAILGSIENRAITGATWADPNLSQSLYMYQFGATLQAEYRFLNGDLEIGLDVGFASGDSAPGFGLYPRRQGTTNKGISTVAGDIDGPQFNCEVPKSATSSSCSDNEVRNFRFNPDYRVDMILYREILGGITDSIYFKPRAKYRITQGFDVFVGGIYSRAMFLSSTPGSGYGATDPSLGIELNGGVRYETEEGFFGQLQYGILFPLDGFRYTSSGAQVTLDFPQALRGMVGIRF
jgi:uncharacterized protein (TIGR04551 family)